MLFFCFPPRSLPALCLHLLLVPLHLPDLLNIGVPSDQFSNKPLFPLLHSLMALNVISTQKHSNFISTLDLPCELYKFTHPFFFSQLLEWFFKTSVKPRCSSAPNPPVAPTFHFNHLFAVASWALSELVPITCLAPPHSEPPCRRLKAPVYLRHLAFAFSSPWKSVLQTSMCLNVSYPWCLSWPLYIK